MSKYPTVSIIFPMHNGGKEPLECLESIEKLDYPKNKIETIVIDNASTDSSNKKIIQVFKRIKLIQLNENLGFAKSINIGIRKSKSKYIFVGNDDLIFGKKSLKYLVDYMEHNHDVGITGGKIFAKYNKLKIESCGYIFNKWIGTIYSAPISHNPHDPDWIQGCAMLIRKKTLQQVGFFDEMFHHFFEDADICKRVKMAKWKVMCVPTAHFWHGGSTTINKHLNLKFEDWYRGKLRYILIHLSLLEVISIYIIHFFIVIPYRTIVLRDRRLLPFISGVIWNAKNIGKILQLRSKYRHSMTVHIVL